MAIVLSLYVLLCNDEKRNSSLGFRELREWGKNNLGEGSRVPKSLGSSRFGHDIVQFTDG